MKKITRRKFMFSMFGIGASAIGYGRFLEPFWLEVNQEQLRFNNKSLKNSIRILHLADLHASTVVPYKFINKAVDLGLSYRPDLICLTGDFITGDISNFDQYRKILSKLSSTAPTFACLGNHDGGIWVQPRGGYANTSKVQQLLKESGITCLHNHEKDVVIHNQELHLIGLGDLWAQEMHPQKVFSETKIESHAPIIVLSHNPDTKDILAVYDWDLMLSGHTHGGQLRIPLIGAPYSPVRDKRYLEGLHNCNGKWIHITKGVGNVYGVRLNCRPQVSLIDLV